MSAQQGHSGGAVAFRAPQTPMEQALCEMWATRLGVDAVGLDDDFLVCGGDAAGLAALIEEIEAAWGLSVPPHFPARPTVAELVRLWAEDGDSESCAGAHEGWHETNQSSTGDMPAQTDAPSDEHLHLEVDQADVDPVEADPVDGGEVRREGLTERLLYKGPLWREHVLLPYGAGVRLQRQWIRLQFVQTRYAAGLYALRMWQQRLGDSASWEAVATRHLLASTWHRWRRRALAAPHTFEEWVTARDTDARAALQSARRGIVLVVPHCLLYTVAENLPELRGRPRYAIRRWQLLDAPHPDVFHPRSVAERARQVRAALDVLAQNGVVWIAGDGQMGTGGEIAALDDCFVQIRTGAAELAAQTGALAVALFCDMTVNGQIVLNFTVLDDGATGTRTQRIEQMTAQYARLFETHWRQQYVTMQPAVLPVFLAQRQRASATDSTPSVR